MYRCCQSEGLDPFSNEIKATLGSGTIKMNTLNWTDGCTWTFLTPEALTCAQVSEAYLRRAAPRRGPAGQVPRSGAPSETSFPSSRCGLLRAVQRLKRSEASSCAEGWWNGTGSGEEPPCQVTHSDTLLPHTTTALCSARTRKQQLSSNSGFASAAFQLDVFSSRDQGCPARWWQHHAVIPDTK